MRAEQQVPQPPEAPNVHQRANLSRGQLIGLPIMLLVPILALFGVFGESRESASRSREDLELTVHYSARTQFMARQAMAIEVTNLDDRPRENVTVALERAFVDAMAEVSFTPSPSRTTGTQYLFDLGTVPGTATRIVSAHFAPGRYWSRPATVTVSTADGQSLDFGFTMFVYP